MTDTHECEQCPNCPALAAEAAATEAIRDALESIEYDEHGYCLWCGADISGGAEHAHWCERKIALEAVAALERRLARAEALAELVPDAAKLDKVCQGVELLWNKEHLNMTLLYDWFGLLRTAQELRALAARIEEARGQGEGAGGWQ